MKKKLSMNWKFTIVFILTFGSLVLFMSSCTHCPTDEERQEINKESPQKDSL